MGDFGRLCVWRGGGCQDWCVCIGRYIKVTNGR